MPDTPWESGGHTLRVEATLEDLAGNNPGKAFEVDVIEPPRRGFTNEAYRLSFRVP